MRKAEIEMFEKNIRLEMLDLEWKRLDGLKAIDKRYELMEDKALSKQMEILEKRIHSGSELVYPIRTIKLVHP